MKAFDLVNVPPYVFNLALIDPTGCAGVVILNDVPVLPEIGTEVPSTISCAPHKFVPVMVTTVPPRDGPDVGEMLVIVGAIAV